MNKLKIKRDSQGATLLEQGLGQSPRSPGFVKVPLLIFTLAASALILALSALALQPRLRLEADNRNVAVIAEYREVLPLIREAGLPMAEALDYLKKKGIGGLMIRDYSMDDLHKDSVGAAQGPGRPGPDYEGLKAAAESDMPVFYRVAPVPPWKMDEALALLDRILSEYPNISIAAPSGETVIGYPDMTPLSAIFAKHDTTVAQIEFSRQLGAAQLDRLAFPRLIPLHSVTNEELNARRLSRAVMHDRLVRSAVERSVRLLMMRPAASGSAGSALETFGEEVENLAADLQSHGLRIGWPETVFAEHRWSMSWLSALACSLAFLLSLARCLKRVNESESMSALEISAFALSACALAALVWKVPPAARWVGAFTSAFIVTEASLIAMDTVRYQDARMVGRKFLCGFLYAVTGGLAIAALFSEPAYMLRISSFSGVKLTLLLPPLLVVLHDMRRRVHPESLSEFLSRPPLWGELFLGAVLMALMFLLVYRSGNVRFIPGMEARMRAALERLLVARPRSKEIFIGYPCALLFAFAVKNGLWARYREVLRVGVALGFSSIVNSFCHYHTPLFFILLREFHGLWIGALIGIASVLGVKYIVLPIFKRLRPLVQ